MTWIVLMAYPAIVFKSGGHQPVLRTHYDTADKQQQHNQGTHPNYVTKDYRGLRFLHCDATILPKKTQVGEYITYRKQ